MNKCTARDGRKTPRCRVQALVEIKLEGNLSGIEPFINLYFNLKVVVKQGNVKSLCTSGGLSERLLCVCVRLVLGADTQKRLKYRQQNEVLTRNSDSKMVKFYLLILFNIYVFFNVKKMTLQIKVVQ